MNHHWEKTNQMGEGVISHHTNGENLLSGKTSGTVYERDPIHTNTIKDLDFLIEPLPDELSH